MRWLHQLRLRLRSLFHGSRLDRELGAELRFHLDEQVAENLAAGMDPDEARAAAMRTIGGIAQLHMECRDMRRVNFIEDFFQDLRYAVRTLRKSPLFTAVAVLSLAFGIGVNTAVFSLIDHLLLQELNVAGPDTLVSLHRILPDGAMRTSFTVPVFEQLRDHNDVFAGMIASTGTEMNVSVDGAPSEFLDAGFCSGNYYSVLGVPAFLGRTFSSEDDQPGKPAVAVISYRYWKNRFAGNASALGTVATAKGVPVTIIGIAPPGFTGLAVAAATDRYPDITLPLIWHAHFELNDHGLDVDLTARMKEGVAIPQARAGANVVFSRVLRETLDPYLPEERKRQLLSQSLELKPAGRGNVGQWHNYRLRLTVLMSVVAVVLLICCANIANLQLARASGRHREMAVRLAIGAGRARLIRQLLTESVLLGLLGGAAGLWFAVWADRALKFILGLQGGLTLDWRVLGFSTVISLTAGIVFGLAPAFRSTRVDLATSLKERAAAIAGPGFAIGKALVILQVALSLLLMIGAGLMLRTLMNLSRIDPGFDRENVLLFWILPTTAGYDGPAELRLYEKVLDKFNHIPGIVHASMARHNLMQGGFHSAQVAGARTAVNAIAPGFFATMRVSVLAGRDFSETDKEQTPKVAIVNQRFARTHFAAENPLGKRFVIEDHPGKRAVEIIGVIRDVRYHGLREKSLVPAEEVYIPFTQAPRDMLGQMVFALRTNGAPMNMLAPAWRAMQAIDKNVPLVSATTQAQEVQESIGEERSLAALTEFFSVLALLLACIGLYGVMSYTVARRTGEFGVRLALGAQRSDVYALVLRESTRMVMVGIAVGILAALGATRYLASVLYGIEPVDLPTFAAVTLLLAAIALLASWLPARRATRVDPLVALRYE